MLEFLQWIIGWIQVIPWLVMGASLVVSYTYTSGRWLSQEAYKVLDWVALNVGKAKD